jgi:acetyl esterase/lipase
MSEADQILKVDAAGRVWTPRERREAVLDEFERSGLPASEFAAHIGVKYPTFAAWRQKRRRQHDDRQHVALQGGEIKTAKDAKPAALRWVEAAVETSATAGAGVLVVHLPGGAWLEVADGSQARLAAALLRALGAGGAGC